MTGFNHALTGAVIAITVKRPELAVPLAFLSHFVQDAIPHWDYGTGHRAGGLFGRRFNTFLACDFIFSLILMAFIGGAYPDKLWLIWACMVAAAAPDLAWGYYYLYVQNIKQKKVHLDWLSNLHKKLEWSETPQGIIIEAAWLVIFGSLILILR